jgi:hypothetical protein
MSFLTDGRRAERGVSELKSSASPFDFPWGGRIRNAKLVGGALAASPTTLLSVSGSGIVRHIHFVFGVGVSWTFISDSTIKIYYGGEETPTVSCPLLMLFGYGLESGWAGTEFCTEWFDVTSGPSGTNTDVAMVLRYPIPFTNGIIITVENSGTAITLYANVEYQDELPACWNRNLKFRADCVSSTVAKGVQNTGTLTKTGTAVVGSSTAFDATYVGKYLKGGEYNKEALVISVANTTHLTVSADDTAEDWTAGTSPAVLCSGITWLSRPAGKRGWITGVMFSASPSLNVESLIRLYLNGDVASATVENPTWSGTEDFFGGCYGWSRPYQGRTHGCVQRVYQESPFLLSVSVYRLFRENPLRYINGIVGKKSIDSHDDDEVAKWLVTGYEET